jgi:hypothetical protein
MGQQETHAPLQTASLFDHLAGAIHLLIGGSATGVLITDRPVMTKCAPSS